MMARIPYPSYKEIVTTNRSQVKCLKKLHLDVYKVFVSTANLLLLLIFSFLFLGAVDDLLDLHPEENGMKHLCISVSFTFQS